MFPEMPGILRGEERALMMIEPPGKFRRIGIFEIDDDVFIAIEKAALPGVRGAVGHSAEMKIRFRVETLPVKAIKKRGRCRTVEAAIVKTEPYAGHGSGRERFPFAQRKKSFRQSS